MKIDVDKLAKAVADSTLSGSAMDALAHLIALARVGAAAVEERRAHSNASVPFTVGVQAMRTTNELCDQYIATHPEGGSRET